MRLPLLIYSAVIIPSVFAWSNNVTVMVTVADITALRSQNDLYSNGYHAVTILAGGYEDQSPGGLFVAQGQNNAIDDGGVVVVDGAGVAWKRSYSGTLNVEWFGADPSGEADSFQAINNTINYALTSLDDIVFPTGIYTVNEGLNIPSHISIAGVGAVTLDFSSLQGNATALAVGVVDPGYNVSSPQRNAFQNGKLSNMLIIGGSSGTGILLAAQTPAYNIPLYTLEKLYIDGFGIGVEIGTQTWLNGIYSCAIFNYYQYGFYVSGAENEGEELSIYNSVIFNAASQTAIGAFIDRGDNRNADVNFFGTSFDYNNSTGVVVQSGQARFFGCHFEGDLSVTVRGGYAEFFGCWIDLDEPLTFDGGMTNFFGGWIPETNPIKIASNVTVNFVDRQIGGPS